MSSTEPAVPLCSRIQMASAGYEGNILTKPNAGYEVPGYEVSFEVDGSFRLVRAIVYARLRDHNSNHEGPLRTENREVCGGAGSPRAYRTET